VSLISTLSIAYTTTPNVLYPRHIQRNSGALLSLAEFNVIAETLTLPYGGLHLNEKAAQAETRLQPPLCGMFALLRTYIGLICDGGAESFIDSPDIKRRDNCDRLRTG
jgi:hypothetical protein